MSVQSCLLLCIDSCLFLLQIRVCFLFLLLIHFYLLIWWIDFGFEFASLLLPPAHFAFNLLIKTPNLWSLGGWRRGRRVKEGGGVGQSGGNVNSPNGDMVGRRRLLLATPWALACVSLARYRVSSSPDGHPPSAVHRTVAVSLLFSFMLCSSSPSSVCASVFYWS